MRWRIFMLRALASVLIFAVSPGFAADVSPAVRTAVAALQSGNFVQAEAVLRADVKEHPGDPSALTLLGVALDSQKKYDLAAPFHERAAALAPRSPDVLNNFANHKLNAGDAVGARKLYLSVLALDASAYNANVQLARMALSAKHGAETLTYLEHLPAGRRDAPNLAPLEIAGLYLEGRSTEADSLAARWLEAAPAIPGASAAIGSALAEAGQFNQAERFFTQALSQSPSDFGILVNLGLAAWHAGHLDRARETLQAAIAQQPHNVDTLYYLACVEHATNHTESALSRLVEASRLAPQRADIERELALAAADLGALDDSAAAWERYAKLAPDDDIARRERGLVAFQQGKLAAGIAEIEWFVARHPEDAVGHFELGAAKNKEDPDAALKEFNQAIELNPDLAAARSARGSLYYQMGNFAGALTDLEAAAKLRPNDAAALDRLGQTYSALDRPADAVRVLQQAAALTPDDSKTQLHLARALADAGRPEESKAAMDRFRQLGPAAGARTIPSGFVDYLSLSPEQRRADYFGRAERQARSQPDSPEANLDYLRALLENGRNAEAAEMARKLSVLKSPPAVLAAAGRALLEAEQYGPARELLARATPSTAVELQLAVATFHTSGANEASKLLDQIPDAARGGDYYLARAEILQDPGAITRAVELDGKRPQTYVSACAILLRARQLDQALRISAQALNRFSQDRSILMLRAFLLVESARGAEAKPLLAQIENRWPETPDSWILKAFALAWEGKQAEAVAAFQTALALGGSKTELNAYLGALTSNEQVTPLDFFRTLFKQTNFGTNLRE